MPQACTVCASPARRAVDRALVDVSRVNTRIAATHGLKETAIRHHAEHHLPARLVKAKAPEEAADADTLLADVRDIKARMVRIFDKAEREGDYRSAISAARAELAALELLAELLHEINRQPQVNVLVTPEWRGLEATVYGALEPYPEARYALASALRSLGEAPNGRD